MNMDVKKIEETNETYYYETNEEILEFMLKEISKSKSINELPIKKDLIEKLKENFNYNDDDEAEYRAYEVFFGIWVGAKVVIADGTEVRMDLSLRCFNDSYPFEHEIFYEIPEIDTYICLECGLWQKSYDDIKREVMYYDARYIKLLPFDWSIKGIRAYLARGVEMQEEYEKNKRRNNRNCHMCIHYKNKECEHGYDEFDFNFDRYFCEGYKELY